MSYQVSARKYRPQQFSDLEGQGVAVRALQNAIKRNRIPHAYLFSGPRGVGKTTLARILAKALNCLQGPVSEPCGQCSPCLEITRGNDMDVVEIDAASNRGIDDIRRLRDIVQFIPVRDRYKIFIIDEAHQLSSEAFNALLKTLEEPPGHVKFVLATTEKQKVPITILSRCQQFDFQLIPVSAIAGRLQKILATENISYSSQAIEQIAFAAEGSLRDALSLLDQVISYCGAEATNEEVEAVLGVVDFSLLEQLTHMVRDQKPAEVLQLIEQVYKAGIELQVFCRRFLQHIRNLMVAGTVGPDPKLLNVTESQAPRLESLSKAFSTEDLIRFLDILGRAEQEMRWAYYPRFSLELALLKMTTLPRMEPITDLITEMRRPASGPISNLPAIPSTAGPALTNTPPKSPVVKSVGFQTNGVTVKGLEPEELLRRLREKSPQIASWLGLALSQKWLDKTLQILFPHSYRLVYEKLKEDANSRLLEQTAIEIFGEGTQISLELDQGNNVGMNTLPEKGSESDPLVRVRKDPVLSPFLEHFPGEVTIKER